MSTSQKNKTGTANFTVSLMLDSESINRLLKEVKHPPWTQALLKELESKNTGTRLLRNSIEPMFNDVSDRSRNLFVSDFLIDADSIESNAVILATHGIEKNDSDNVSQIVNISIPRNAHWTTEGTKTELILGFIGESETRIDVLKGVICRAFWVAHSNEALSFHLSMEVPLFGSMVNQTLETIVQESYGLAFLQKALFPSEGTDWLLRRNDGLKFKQLDPETGKELSELVLTDFLLHEVGRQLKALLNQIGIQDGTKKTAWSPTQDWLDKVRDILLYPKEGKDQIVAYPLEDAEDTKVEEWVKKRWLKDLADRRRLLIVVENKEWFDLIKLLAVDVDKESAPTDKSSGKTKTQNETPNKIVERVAGQTSKLFESLLSEATQNGNTKLLNLGNVWQHFSGTSHHSQRTADKKASAIDFSSPKLIFLVFFLSGFFQNIIDFHAQDWLEIADGLEPLSPAPKSGEDGNSNFLFYATPYTTFELVARSRSLQTGLNTIGTCPYVFLSHLLSFQNEFLTKAYEVQVSKLILDMRLSNISNDSAAQRFAVDTAFRNFKQYRLDVFEKVHKHFSLNIFRYDTEKTFFNKLQTVRGVNQRREYWDGVIEKLAETVESLREEQQKKRERKLSIVLGVVAILGFFQVVFQVHESLLTTAKQPTRGESKSFSTLPQTFDFDLANIEKTLIDQFEAREKISTRVAQFSPENQRAFCRTLMKELADRQEKDRKLSLSLKRPTAEDEKQIEKKQVDECVATLLNTKKKIVVFDSNAPSPLQSKASARKSASELKIASQQPDQSDAKETPAVKSNPVISTNEVAQPSTTSDPAAEGDRLSRMSLVGDIFLWVLLCVVFPLVTWGILAFCRIVYDSYRLGMDLLRTSIRTPKYGWRVALLLILFLASWRTMSSKAGQLLLNFLFPCPRGNASSETINTDEFSHWFLGAYQLCAVVVFSLTVLAIFAIWLW